MKRPCGCLPRRPHRSHGFERLYAVASDGLKVTFECKEAGHRFIVDYGKARSGARRYATGHNAALLKRWCSPGGYWSKEQGGVMGACDVCHELTNRGAEVRQ